MKKTLKLYCVVNEAENLDKVDGILHEYRNWIWETFGPEADLEWKISHFPLPVLPWIYSHPYFGLDFRTTNKFSSEAVGCHSIWFFYTPDGAIEPQNIAAWTYTVSGKPQVQIRLDSEPTLNLLKHEGTHAMFQNLNEKGVKLQDTTDAGLPMDLANEIEVLKPHWDKICEPMPIDGYIGKLLAQISSLTARISAIKSYQAFRSKWLGKGIDFDGNYGYQCVDVYRQYCKELGISQSPAVNFAQKIWFNFLPEEFERIEDSPTAVPQPGDIVIWDYDPAGHIAICDSTFKGGFKSFGQNWQEPISGLGVCKISSHSYNHVLGWLRRRPAKLENK